MRMTPSLMPLPSIGRAPPSAGVSGWALAPDRFALQPGAVGDQALEGEFAGGGERERPLVLVSEISVDEFAFRRGRTFGLRLRLAARVEQPERQLTLH
jgi:hypothetical protein